MPVYLPGLTFGSGYGGAPYGTSPYGGAYFPRPPVSVTGGFGGSPYSYSSYGSLGSPPPKISSAISITGFVIRVFFSEEMQNDANLVDPANYNLADIYGVPVSPISVVISSYGIDGVTSVEITHTGTTLGGQYNLTAINITSYSGIPLSSPNNRYTILTLGDTTTFTVSELGTPDGRTYILNFFDSLSRAQPLLTELDFTPGVNNPISYGVEGEYPITPVVSSATQDSVDLSEVVLEIEYLTETDYEMVSGPSIAFDYTGVVLPEDDPSFTGNQIGIGTGTVSSSGLFLSKTAGNSFGYSFGDTTGRIQPNSSFVSTITIDVTGSSISPTPFNQTFAIYSISDGVIEVSLLLRDIAGTKIVEVVSGSYSTQIPCPWGSIPTTISLVRNQKADFYSVVCHGYPEVTFSTASATGSPTYGAGSAFVLSPGFAVNLFKISEVKFTSTQTLFTSHWNFLHSLVTPFTGTSLLARNVIRTKRGPLVRGWGDNTIAQKEDVEVRVNGVAVDIAKINPYIGEIYPTIPIPLSPAGTFTIEIDYIWFQNPALPMLGLNTQGLSLNTWDRPDGHTAKPKSEYIKPSAPYGKSPYGKDMYGGASYPPLEDIYKRSWGVTKTNRFPMGIILGPGARKSPKRIGHRYIGFQNDYSALLNKESLLVLNKNPNAISDGYITAEAIQQSGLFNGRTTPTSASTPWTLSGIDNGVVIGDGTYRLVDNSSGSYRVGYESIYSRELDLSLENITTEIARFKIESYTPDGVFTGIGFGLYDGLRLGLIGAVLIDGVQHFGLLLDGTNPHLAESWKIGFEYSAVASSQSIIRIAYTGFPNGVESGDRFRIAEGAQAGVYTIAECGLNLIDDYVEITLKEQLPAKITIIGNESFQIFFETKWDQDLCSFRIVADYPKGIVDVNLASEISGIFLSGEQITPYPAQTALLIPAGEKGAAFWGSISRKATNSSVWDIVQYLLSPDKILNTAQGITVQENMNILPQNETLNPWYIVSGFGDSSVNAGVLSLDSNSSSTDKDTSFYYQIVEPYLNNKVETDVETNFRVISGNSVGDAQIQIRDGVRQVSLKTLRYKETGTARVLLSNIPTTSLSGLLVPDQEGWVSAIPATVSSSVTGKILTISKSSSQVADWFSQKTFIGLNPEGCILRWEIKITNTTSGSNGVGLVIGVDMPLPYEKAFNIVYDTGVIRIEDISGTTIIHTFTYNWNDSAFHEYKLTADPITNNVTLIIDGVLIGSFLYSAILDIGSGFGTSLLFLGDGSCTVALNALAMFPLRADPNEKKTLGIQTRYGDPDSIDGYVIPRTDGTGAPNSSLSAIPVEMDFTVSSDVRVFLDPSWGASLYRPDLNMPDGNPYIPGTTNPVNAWVNVEYRNLPVQIQERGSISFGSINPYSVSEQTWDYVYYRVRRPPSGFGIAPQGMVLNRATKLTSGEFLFDKTLEDKTFNSRTATLIYVPDCAIYADRVYKVIVDGVVISSTDYSFDKFTQYIVLSNPLPGEQYEVRIIFVVGKPISKTYLCGEPLDNSVTLLNEGTPPIPKQRSSTPENYYSGVEFCEVEEGDTVTLSSMCDGPGPGKGLAEIEIEGHFTTGAFEVPHGPGGVWGKSSPTFKGSSTHHSLPIFFASGGNYRGPTLSPGSMMLYPNQQVPGGNTGMGINQDFTLRLETVTPYSDTLGAWGDNVPPSSAEPLSINPDGTPGTFNNGAVAFLEEDFGTSISRLGPWGGLSSLANSLLGGGSQLSGVEFTLQGGAQIARPVRTSGVLEAAS